MKFDRKIVILFIMFFSVILGSINAAETISLLDNTNKGGWRFFGYGLLDSGVNQESKEIVIDVDWTSSNWGIGGMYQIDNPVDGKTLQSVKIQVKTSKGSETKLYGGLATANDANVAITRGMAFEIVDEWQIITLPISAMRPFKPSVHSPPFLDNDWKNIQTVKILFVKPEGSEISHERIFIREPELVFKRTSSVKPHKKTVTTVPLSAKTTLKKPKSGNIAKTVKTKKYIKRNIKSESEKPRKVAKNQTKKPEIITISDKDAKKLEQKIIKIRKHSAKLHDRLLTVLDAINTEIDKSSTVTSDSQRKVIGRKISALDKKADGIAKKLTQYRKELFEYKQQLKHGKLVDITDISSATVPVTTRVPDRSKRKLIMKKVELGSKKKFKDENEFENLYQDQLTPGQILYSKVIKLVEIERAKQSEPRDISNLLLKGAGDCRDKGEYKHALKLFEEAIQEDPDNAVAFRIYGDFLMGYRGLYEKAATKYARASELLEESPSSYDTKFRRLLSRSTKIHHRDGQDGIPILETDTFSIYFEGSASYNKPSINSEEPLSMFEQQLTAENQKNILLAVEQNIIDTEILPNGNPADVDDINRALAKVSSFQSQKKAIPRQLARRREEVEYESKILLRFTNENLPYFRFSWSEKYIDTINVNPEDVRLRWDGNFIGKTALVGKNLMLSDDLDLTLEAEYSERRLMTDNPIFNHEESREESDVLDVSAKFIHYFGINSLRLTLGGLWAEIERHESRGPRIDDALNSQRVVLRLSFFKPPEETENPSRFRGRRSDHLEFGFKRTEREFHFDHSVPGQPGHIETLQYTYEPHFSYEMLGLVNGHLDMLFRTKAYQRRYTDTFKKGRYNAYEVEVTPKWVFIYDLYEDDFINGHELLSLAMPMQITFDEQLGSYSRFNTGLQLDSQFVTQSGIRLQPILAFDYAYYPHINRDDWGIFAKCALRY